MPLAINSPTARQHRRHMLLLGKEIEDHNTFVKMGARMLSGGSGFGAGTYVGHMKAHVFPLDI